MAFNDPPRGLDHPARLEASKTVLLLIQAARRRGWPYFPSEMCPEAKGAIEAELGAIENLLKMWSAAP